MSKTLCVVFSCLFLFACTTGPKPGVVSTIPWEDRSQIDGMAQEYAWGEDDYVFSTTAQ